MTRINDEALSRLEKLRGEPLTFGAYVRSLRECDEYSQKELAEKLGVTIQHLSNVENGRKGVSPSRAEQWAEIMGYSKSQFVKLVT
jgi:transcriptional regulator with XRE-family HTH domain